jgi:hypothetical protein
MDLGVQMHQTGPILNTDFLLTLYDRIIVCVWKTAEPQRGILSSCRGTTAGLVGLWFQHSIATAYFANV